MSPPERQKPALSKAALWLPLALLFLPVFMQLYPLVIETDPRRGLYYTPMVIQIFLIAVILFIIFSGATKNIRRTLPKPMLAAAIILLAVVLYSTFFRAQNTTYALEKILDLVSIVLLAILSGFLFEKSPQNLANLCLKAIFWSVVIATPVVAILFVLKLPANNLWPNFMPGFVFVRIYGFSLAGAIALGTGFLAYENTRQKPLIFLALVLLWTALFWSSTRGGIFSIMAVSLVFFIAFPKIRRALGIGLVALALGAALSVFLPVPSDAYGFFNAFDDTFKASSPNRLSAGRLEMWQVMLGQIAEKPLFGYGYAQLTLLAADETVPHAHAHNIVIESALGWGIVGAGALGYFLLHSLALGFIKVRQAGQNDTLPAFFLICVMAVFAWVDGTYFYYQSLIPVAICIGVLMAKNKS